MLERLERVAGMEPVRFAWIVHGNRKLQWRFREHRTRGYSKPLLVLAISGEGASRQRCWRFQGCAEIAALTGDFQGLRVGCRERGTEAISEALHGAAAAEQGVANGNCDLVRKPPAVLAICIR